VSYDAQSDWTVSPIRVKYPCFPADNFEKEAL
jgi:hypothetical protein